MKKLTKDLKKLFDKPVVLMASLQHREDLKKLFDKHRQEQESFKNDFVYQAILYELANLKFIIGEKKEEKMIKTVWINEKLWDVYGTHSKAINDAIKEMIDNTEIKIEVDDTEILIVRDDFDNISIDIYDDGEALGGSFELLGVFDPSDYPYFFSAFEWDGYIYDMDVFREYLDDGIREQVHAEVAPCSETTFIKTYYNKVKNTELASIFDDDFLSQMRRWGKEEIAWY